MRGLLPGRLLLPDRLAAVLCPPLASAALAGTGATCAVVIPGSGRASLWCLAEAAATLVTTPAPTPSKANPIKAAPAIDGRFRVQPPCRRARLLRGPIRRISLQLAREQLLWTDDGALQR